MTLTPAFHMNIKSSNSPWQRLAHTGLAAFVGAMMSWPVAAADESASGAAANVYLAGAEVHTEGPIAGDLVAAAGRIRVAHAVGGASVFAAGSIEVYGNIGDDLRAAGGVIGGAGHVGGEALLAGGSVALGPYSEIDGRAWIAGNDIVVGGRLRYVSCLRFAARDSDGGYREGRARAVLYVDGRLDRLVENAGEICAGATYAPFPELEKLPR